MILHLITVLKPGQIFKFTFDFRSLYATSETIFLIEVIQMLKHSFYLAVKQLEHKNAHSVSAESFKNGVILCQNQCLEKTSEKNAYIVTYAIVDCVDWSRYSFQVRTAVNHSVWLCLWALAIFYLLYFRFCKITSFHCVNVPLFA